MAVSTTSVRRRGITGHWPRCFVTARWFIQWAVSAAQAGGGHGRGPAVASGGRRVPLLRSWNGSLGRGVVAGQPGFGSHWSRVNAVVNGWVQGHVAKLVEPPRTDNRELKPWTLDETLDFLAASRGDPLYATFVRAIAMGLRRGEIIGLRRSDLDLDNRVLYVRQQRQRRRDVLYDDDPKSRRRHAVPLPALCIAPLRWHRMRQSAARAKAGEQWHESGYVFTTRTGRQVEPRNVYRSFTRIADSTGIRVVRLHDARHGTATLLPAAGVASRVVTEILGHSRISITMDAYTHVVQDTQREAMSRMDRLLRRRPDRSVTVLVDVSCGCQRGATSGFSEAAPL